MKKMRKVSKLLSFILTFAMLAAEVPQPLLSYAAEPATSEQQVSDNEGNREQEHEIFQVASTGDFYWDEDGVTITGYKGQGGAVVIPKKAEAIEIGAFRNKTKITSLAFESGSRCRDIYSEAFFGCSALSEVTLGENIEYIGRDAFGECKISEIIFPDSVKQIDDFAFAGCDLKEVVIPEKVEFIGAGAFYNNSELTKLTIEAIAMEDTDYEEYSEVGVFKGCNLSEVIFSPKMSRIAGGLFYLADFAEGTQINLPSGIEAIGDGAFKNVGIVSEITLPSSLKTIGAEAFCSCNLSAITIPENVTEIGARAFSFNFPLSTVVISSKNITKTGSEIFGSCGIHDIKLPEGMTVIPDCMFERATFSTNIDIVLPSTIKEIGRNAFKEIGKYNAPYAGKLTGITLPDGLEIIGESAFESITDLKSISFNAAIKTIKGKAFYNCSGLETIVYGGTEASWAKVVIEEGNDTILKPTEFLGLEGPEYDQDEDFIWDGDVLSAYVGNATEITIPKHCIKVNEEAFYGNTIIKRVSFEKDNKCTVISKRAFADCANLEEVILPDSLEEIGYGAFDGTGLSALVIPDGVEKISAYAFRGVGISEITLPESLVELGEGAFSGCSALSSLVIKSRDLRKTGISGNDSGIFKACNLKTVSFPENMREIPAYLFYEAGFSKELSMVLPDTVSIIGERAFFNSTSLCDITLPLSLRGVESFAFYPCDELDTVTYAGTSGNWAYVRLEEGNDAINPPKVFLDKEETNVSEGDFIWDGSVISGYDGMAVDLVIPAKATAIAKNAFRDCRTLKTVRFENGSLCEKISEGVFEYCSLLKSVKLPESLLEIGDRAFYSCSLSEITLPEKLNKIGMLAFAANQELKKITFETKDFEVSNGGSVFNGATLGQIVFPEGIRRIPSYLFSGTDFEDNTVLELPGTITSIGDAAFYGIKTLAGIKLPLSLLEINANAFYECTNLKDVSYAGSFRDWRNIAIHSGNDAVRDPVFEIEIPYELEDDFKWDGNVITGFYSVSSNLIIPARATKIGVSAFEGNEIIVSLSFEEGSVCSEISERAFAACTKLNDIILPEDIKKIDKYSFSGCVSLDAISFPKALLEISEGAFFNCDSMKYVVYEGSPKAWRSNVSVQFNNNSVMYPTRFIERDTVSGNELDFGTDVWGFKNYGRQPLRISDDDRDSYLRIIEETDGVTVREWVKEAIDEGSTGLCYGFATSVIANKMGYRHIADNLREKKLDNAADSTIACFFLSQNTNTVRNEKYKALVMNKQDAVRNIIAVAEKVYVDGPALLGYSVPADKCGHAVTITGIQRGNYISNASGREYDIKVEIYDSNSVDYNDQYCLYIDDENYKWEIPKYYYDGVYDELSRITLVSTGEECIYPIKFNEYSLDAEASADSSTIRANLPDMISIYDNETLKVSCGDWYAIANHSRVIDGSTDILYDYDLAYVESKKNNSALNIYFPENHTGKTTITPCGVENGPMRYSLLNDGYYISMNVECASGIIIDEDGSIELLGNRGLFELTLALNGVSEGRYNTYKFSNDEGKVTGNIAVVINDDGGLIISGDNLNGLNLVESSLDSSKTVTVDDNKGSFEIDGENREGLTVQLANASTDYVYTGSAITPAVVVKNNGKVLTEGIDYKVSYKNNVNASTAKKPATITVSGIGNYSGKASAEFTIKAKSIAENDTAGSTLAVQDDRTYSVDSPSGVFYVLDGKKPAPVLTYGGYTLAAKDYTIKAPAGNVSKDTISITIEGKGNFGGAREIPVSVISPSEQKKLKVTIEKESDAAALVYDGTEKKPTKITVTDSKDKSKVLKEGTDYEVCYPKDITSAGTVKITVAGKGLYTGSVKATYKILPIAEKDTKKFTVRMIGDTTYKAGGVTPELLVSYNDLALTAGKDYKLSCSGNKKAGSSAKYTISFLGNYKGSAKLSNSFTISKASMSSASVTAADKIYSKPNTYVSAPIVCVNGTQLAKGEYTVKYLDGSGKEINSKNKIDLSSADSATVTVKVEAKESGNYSGSASGTYKVIKLSNSSGSTYTDISKASVTIMPKGQSSGKKLSKLSYTGSAITFATNNAGREGDLIVTVGKGSTAKTLTYGVDYTVTYVNNVNKGKATMIITGVPGNGYAGSKSVNFTIGTKDVGLLGSLLKKLFG